MKQRIVSSRLLVNAHPNHVYKFLENLDNHRQFLPGGVSDWTSDKDSARYRTRIGLQKNLEEVTVVERIPGIRVGVESAGNGLKYKRWYKIQADEKTSILEISMEFEQSAAAALINRMVLRGYLEKALRNLKSALEKPREAVRAPAAVTAPAPDSSSAPAPSPAAPPQASAGQG